MKQIYTTALKKQPLVCRDCNSSTQVVHLCLSQASRETAEDLQKRYADYYPHIVVILVASTTIPFGEGLTPEFEEAYPKLWVRITNN